MKGLSKISSPINKFITSVQLKKYYVLIFFFNETMYILFSTVKKQKLFFKFLTTTYDLLAT